MKSFIQRARLLSASALAALALAACGGAAATTTPTTAAVATSAPAAEPTAGAASEPTAGSAAEPTAGTAAEPTTASSAPTSAAAATSAPAATSTKLNLNDVTEGELMATIPGFGSRMVREFMEYRPYTSIQQFRQEIGKYVSAEQVAEYEKYVYVPIDVNQADAATLQQIPGVDASAAEQLIAGRPYADTAAFLAKLAEVGAGIDAAQAQAFLAQ